MVFFFGLDLFVVVVYCYGQCVFGGILFDDVVFEEFLDFGWFGQFVEFYIVGVGEFFFDDFVIQVDVFIVDVYVGVGNEFFDLFLVFFVE